MSVMVLRGLLAPLDVKTAPSGPFSFPQLQHGDNPPADHGHIGLPLCWLMISSEVKTQADPFHR